MEERKTAAIVLGIIALVLIFFTVILPEIRIHGTQTLSFKSCTVHFEYEGPAAASDIYRASQNKLALCLCRIYKQNADTAVGNHILGIYKQYGSCLDYDSIRATTNIDSIIKHKNAVFDTVILVD